MKKLLAIISLVLIFTIVFYSASYIHAFKINKQIVEIRRGRE